MMNWNINKRRLVWRKLRWRISRNREPDNGERWRVKILITQIQTDLMKLKILIIRLILSQFRIFHLPLSKELLLGKLVLIYIEIIIQKIVKKNKKKMINNLKTTQNPTSRCLVSAASNTPWIFTTNVKFSLSRNP